jgi:hypothetical protein
VHRRPCTVKAKAKPGFVAGETPVSKSPIEQKGEKMKDATKILLSLSAVLAAVAQVPAVQAVIATFVLAHPSLASLGALLTFVGSLMYQPKTQ